jgi:hypothetical protein
MLGRNASRIILFGAAAIVLASGQLGESSPAQAQTTQSAATKQVGTIKAIAGNSITLATDAGAEFTVQVSDATKMARVEPGQTDLKGATAIHLPDLQVGDRILVRGPASEDGKTISAAVVIAMKGSDVQARQEQERLDWQKRGMGGLVSAVDPAAATVTVSYSAAGAKKSVLIHTTNTTIFRRYAPDSVKFDEAKPSSLSAIKPGDQLRARGTRNPDGTEFTAEEIVAGSFQNIAGTITAVDAAANTVTVKDLISKKDVAVKITADSEVRKLPPQMAQFIAMRLKGVGPGGGANGAPGAAGQARPTPTSGSQPGHAGGMGGNRGGAPDLQQVLGRMPPTPISDLQKGDAVMIVSTEGSSSGTVTAITLVAGVEPILQASPGGQMMTLSPWSLGASSGEEGGGGETPQQ